MNEAQAEQDDDKILFLQQLVEDRATVAADVVEVDAHTRVIHGVIPVGGDVIMAELETQDHAKKAVRAEVRVVERCSEAERLRAARRLVTTAESQDNAVWRR